MTTPIKPPASTPLPQPGELEKASEASGPGQAPEVPAAKLQRVSGELAVDAVAEPAQVLARELRAGTVDVQTAVERLVERAVQGAGMGVPSGEMRKELESFLRAALADDPSLVALAAELERGFKTR